MGSLCLAPIFEGKLRSNYDRNDTTSPAYIREQPWEKTATKSDVGVPNYPLGAHDLGVRIWPFPTPSMCRKYDQHMSTSDFCGFISQIKRVIPHYQLLFVRVAATAELVRPTHRTDTASGKPSPMMALRSIPELLVSGRIRKFDEMDLGKRRLPGIRLSFMSPGEKKSRGEIWVELFFFSYPALRPCCSLVYRA